MKTWNCFNCDPPSINNKGLTFWMDLWKYKLFMPSYFFGKSLYIKCVYIYIYILFWCKSPCVYVCVCLCVFSYCWFASSVGSPVIFGFFLVWISRQNKQLMNFSPLTSTPPTNCGAMMASFISSTRHDGGWHPFKTWLVWFKRSSFFFTSLLTCSIVRGRLSAWTNLVVPPWPHFALRLFCPPSCY